MEERICREIRLAVVAEAIAVGVTRGNVPARPFLCRVRPGRTVVVVVADIVVVAVIIVVAGAWVGRWCRAYGWGRGSVTIRAVDREGKARVSAATRFDEDRDRALAVQDLIVEHDRDGQRQVVILDAVNPYRPIRL